MDDVTETLLLVLVVVTALAFDFTNGFHDTGNAMATSIATKALKPKTAVALSAVLAGLVGGITWNLLTWLLGIPSSSSHALIGGVVGSVLAAVGTQGVIWSGVAAKVLIPALLAPLIAIGVASVG